MIATCFTLLLLAIRRTSLVAPIALGLCTDALATFEHTLPPVGTVVTTDFVVSTPDLVIATATPSSVAFAAEVRFTEGKFLRVMNSDVFTLHVDVIFHAPGIVNAFEPIYVPFNESLELLRADGTPFAVALKNSSLGEDPDGNIYGFGWDFHPLDEFRIHGLRWNITPDLATGATLPATLDLELSMWGEFPILVAPEPTSLALALAGLSLLAPRRRPR